MNDDLKDRRGFWRGPVQHVINLTAEERHIDMFGHVNNAWYIAWAMDCAWAHSDALGLDYAAYERIGVGCVVRHHEYTYYASALAGDRVAVGTWIARNDGRMRMIRAIEMRRMSDGKLLVAGETEFVAVNIKSGKPARMPAEYARLYAPPDELSS